MSSIIEYSPFISFGVLFAGIYYESWLIFLIGITCFILSFIGLLCQCGSDLRDEVERAN